MKKHLLLLCLLSCTLSGLFAQSAKKHIPTVHSNNPTPAHLNLSGWPHGSVPPAANVFGLPVQDRQPIAFTSMGASVKTVIGDNGLPILFQGKTAASGSASDNRAVELRAIEYLTSLQPAEIQNPATAFVVKSVQTDEQGNQHVRLEQRFQGVAVFGSELIAHTKDGAFVMANGRYYPTPRLQSVQPAIDAPAAIQKIMGQMGPGKVKTTWTDEERNIIGGDPYRSELVVFHPGGDLTQEHLAWYVEAHPDLMRRIIYFVDAQTGAILHSFDYTCHLVPELDNTVLTGPVTASGTDLLGQNRTFGAWDAGGQILLEDAGKPMYNSASSNMPDNPVGAIVTLDALNTSPQSQFSFNYDFVKSGSTTFNNPTAVRAHYNAGKSYDYYQSTFNRNSIDGGGGNIVSFVNVSNEDGSSMENAFWNGVAMWYGNGGTYFKKLAAGLDVGGHEMTHGVVEKTANLVYEGESGALNESFADVFATMIDRNNWTIGEQVMQSGINATGVLRDLANPHNGSAQGSPWWQPQHVNEQYAGTQDNGGVHINSGIPNHALYLFANDPSVGRNKAEQVYYKALRDYLVKSSKFVDCRIAVLQAATDLYGNSVATVAASAFDAVGITGSQPGGNYLGQLNPNPGIDLIISAANGQTDVDISLGNGILAGTVYNQGIISRPSVQDNGIQAVFVNANHQIVGISFDYSVNPPTFYAATLSEDTVWRNAAISKDGRFLAGITTNLDNKVVFYDLADPFPTAQEYFLVNPTYSQGNTSTSDVKFADILEFDYSGSYLMYDAYNKLSNSQGQDISYWDIGFLKFWDNNAFANNQNPTITKLFNGLPEKVSVDDPTFAKNSPYVIAFDLSEDLGGGQYNISVYGANTETGDYGPLVTGNGLLGYPSFTRLDDAILYQDLASGGGSNLKLQGIKPSKIEPTGSAAVLVPGHQWGVWYSNGNRGLMVGTHDIAGQGMPVSVAPNPAHDRSGLTIHAKADAGSQIVLIDLFGRVLQSRYVQLTAGDNRLDIDLQGLPAGSYVVRVSTADATGSVTLIKQ
jgi:Zn-dependent metalloprotease